MRDFFFIVLLLRTSPLLCFTLPRFSLIVLELLLDFFFMMYCCRHYAVCCDFMIPFCFHSAVVEIFDSQLMLFWSFPFIPFGPDSPCQTNLEELTQRLFCTCGV
ncbi:hypothetical protein NE237_023621 [Protea cynaroides]|uniref:Uncharacterized protein n=1 Tax=Protea cynaroides TaxID=273540 RepID=A0A9Q0HC32_9MAGN|nr:hypothetical protein NE237_023621 [Protea cynaroides]